MSFYENKNPAVNVVISKNEEAVTAFLEEGIGGVINSDDAFLDENIDTATMVLSTGNGTLISMKDASEYYGNKLTVSFVDFGGETLKQVFKLNYIEAAQRGNVVDNTNYFLISYGVGPDKHHFSEPMWYSLNGVNSVTNTDGLDLIELEFGPIPSRSIELLKGVGAKALTYVNTKEIAIADVDEHGNYRLYDKEQLAFNIRLLVEHFCESIYGLPTTFLIGMEQYDNVTTFPNYIQEYVDKEIEQLPLPYNAIFTQNTEPRVHGAEGILSNYFDDTLRKKFKRLGIDSFITYTEYYGMDLANPTEAPFQPDVLSISIDRKYRRRLVGKRNASYISRFLKDFYKGLRFSLGLDGGRFILEAAAPYVVNSRKSLKKLKELGYIDDDSIPNVLLGDIVRINTIKNILNDRDADFYGDDEIGTTVITPRMTIETGHNLISFNAQAIPNLVESFRNNVFFDLQKEKGLGADADTPYQLSRQEYVDFIAGYLKNKIDQYRDLDTPGAYNTIDYFDGANFILDYLQSEEDTPLGNMYLANGSDFSDLAEYLQFFWRTAMTGNLLAEAEILPDFSINRDYVGRGVDVFIKKNPTPYSDKPGILNNSFYSGEYRLKGYIHSLDNNSVSTKVQMHKVTLGELK